MAPLYGMPDQSSVPDTVAKADKLMLVGAALAGVQGIVAALYELHRPAVAAAAVASGLIVAGVWWLVARACAQGRKGARIFGTVVFGLATLGIAQTLGGKFHPAPAVTVCDVLSWCVGLAAVVLLWHRDSAGFFRADTRR